MLEAFAELKSAKGKEQSDLFPNRHVGNESQWLPSGVIIHARQHA
jgi:hypothetical protein